MATLERAIEMAVKAHKGQTDPYGEEYIKHPRRVMVMGRTEEEKTVGILHDVVEDTDLTLYDLAAEGFPEEIVKAVAALTHDKERETYEDYITRLSSDPLAVAVKVHDLTDNMDPRRLPVIGEREVERLKKYHAAYLRLKPLYPHGPELVRICEIP